MPEMKTWTANGVTFDIRDQNSEDHINMTGNPHGTTAADVGARPDTWVPTVEDLNITAESIGARPDTWVPSVEDLNITAESIGAASLDYAKKVGAPRNLLDNSYWENPSEIVNQRGQNKYTAGYGFDRWRIYADNTCMEKSDGCVVVTGAGIWQNLERVSGDVYTLVAKAKDGTISLATGNFASGTTSPDRKVQFSTAAVGQPSVFIGAGEWVWTALYEGEYTAETLPEYHPKGYGAELMECMKYLQVYRPQSFPNVGTRHAPLGVGLANNSYTVEIDIPLPVPIRKGVVPSLVYSGDLSLWNGIEAINPTGFVVGHISDAVLRLSCTSSGAEIARIYSLSVLNTNMDGYFMINAEL